MVALKLCTCLKICASSPGIWFFTAKIVSLITLKVSSLTTPPSKSSIGVFRRKLTALLVATSGSAIGLIVQKRLFFLKNNACFVRKMIAACLCITNAWHLVKLLLVTSTLSVFSLWIRKSSMVCSALMVLLIAPRVVITALNHMLIIVMMKIAKTPTSNLTWWFHTDNPLIPDISKQWDKFFNVIMKSPLSWRCTVCKTTALIYREITRDIQTS